MPDQPTPTGPEGQLPPQQPQATPPAPVPAPQAGVPAQPAPAAAKAPKPKLTPEQKKAARKQAMKRLGLVVGILYVLVLVFIFVFAAALASGNATSFEGLLMNIAHVQFLIPVGVGLVLSLLGLFKSIRAKKEEVEKKKKASKSALIGGGIFLISALLWLVAIIYLAPKLTPEQFFSSSIVTDPATTIGLTAPVDVEFDASGIPIDSGVYRILSYTWDFGDGDTGSSETVTHRYSSKPAGGLYTVTLVVDYMDLKSGEQFDQEFTTTVGIDNEEVAAVFTATPDSGNLPLEVEFDASDSYDPDGEIASYEWDLDGDGDFDDDEGALVTYTYTQEGEYEVSLRVTDNVGEYDVFTTSIEAGSVGGLRAVISTEVQSDEFYYTGEEYDFDGSLSQITDGNIVKYVWDFDDGSDDVQGKSTSHEFDEAGEYTISLSVSDADGNIHTDEEEIVVVDVGTPPTAEIETDSTKGPVPLSVDFDGSGSTDPEDDIVEYLWDLDGDGEIDETGDKVEYTYTEVDTYEATLTVIDAGGNEDSRTVEIEVTEQGIVASFTTSESAGEVPLTVTFDASASSYKEGEIVSYEYDFGDGNTYIGDSKISYKYTDVGNFTVSVTVIGDDGETDTDTLQVVVRPVSLTACFTVNTSSGSAPLFVSVNPSCSTGTISDYVWDFDDGEISFDRKPDTHTYSEIGIYTITLELTSDEGVVDTFTKDVTVK